MNFETLLERLTKKAGDVDAQSAWPTQQLDDMAQADVLGWVIPKEFGGTDISAAELSEGYEKLATACLATTFVLTQRNGACQRIVTSQNESLKAELLPKLVSGEIFATVGISHLTTSRQHLKKPAVEVELHDDSVTMNGLMPWVTGAEFADYIVTGGTASNGEQVLVALPTKSAGVQVNPPAKLMALTGSYTTSVVLENVSVSRSHLLAGPIENVMSQGTGGGAGSLTTSALAIGLCQRALNMLQQESQRRDNLQTPASQFADILSKLRSDFYLLANGQEPNNTVNPQSIRQRANSLALRITQAALAATKGAGFLQGHPAELAVREAMFFLVWSCPQPVVDGVLAELACSD